MPESSYASVSMANELRRSVVSRSSPYGFDATVKRVWEVIARRGLNVFTIFDHRPSLVDDERPRPCEVVVFGDPATIERDVKAQPVVGLELPLRLMVHEADDVTKLTYNDPSTMLDDFGVDSSAIESFADLRAVVDDVLTDDSVVIVDADSYRRPTGSPSSPSGV